MKEYSYVLEQQSHWQMVSLCLMLAPEPVCVSANGETSYRRFVEVLPEEPVQGLAVACQNRLNIRALNGDHTAKEIAGRRLTSNRPKTLARELYDGARCCAYPPAQCGLYVARIMETAFLNLAVCSEAAPLFYANAL